MNNSKFLNTKKSIMKKFFKFIPAALAVVALSSCSSDDLFGFGNNTKADGNTIQASIGAESTTRAAMGVTSEGERGLVFSADDQLNVYTMKANTFNNYTLASGANTDKATFTKASGDLDITDGEDYYAVVKSPAARIYGLSANADNKPQLTMQIPARYTHAKVDATWGEDKSGSSYKMPIPLWGKVSEDNGEMSVGFNYTTGFMKIEVVNLRAGSKSIKLTASRPISGYFNAVLDTETPANTKFAVDEALTNDNTIIVDFPQVNTYEGVDSIIYLPIIAQTYPYTGGVPALKVDVLDADDNVIETIYEAQRAVTVQSGHGISLVRGMNVYSDATDGKDISSKLYELTQKNDGKPILMQVDGVVTATNPIIIDKNTTNEITLSFSQAIPAGLTIVEGTAKSVDSDGNVTWSTEMTSVASESQAKKHKVTIVYDNKEANGNLNLYLPNSELILSGKDIDAVGGADVNYAGNVEIIASTDAGFIVDETARFAGNVTDKKDGKVTINGFVANLIKEGNGDVTINNLNEPMTSINMGNGNTVSGNLTINGATTIGGVARSSTNLNDGSVVTITSQSTGTFAANNLDENTTATAEAWTFNEAGAGISISNNIANPLVNAVTVNKKNNLSLANVIVTTYNYTAGKKATISTTGRSAIKTLTGDNDDMLTISTTWDGNTAPDAATAIVQAVADVVNTEVHTAYQLASVPATAVTIDIKSTTTIDLNNLAWTAKNMTAAFTLDGDCNNNGAVAKIKNLKNTTVPVNVAGTLNGLFGTTTAKATIKNLAVEGVDLENHDYTGTLIANATAGVDIDNVTVTGATLKSQEASGNGGLIGSLAGAASTIDAVSVTATEISNSNQKAGGLIGWSKIALTANDIAIASTTVKANDIVGGLIGESDADVTIAKTTTGNTINITTLENTNTKWTGGLIGYKTAGVLSAQNVAVTIGTLKGLWFMGGMIGQNVAGDATFGNVSKETLCSVNVTNFVLNSKNNATNKATKNKYLWGTVNTYIGGVKAGDITITKYCKHGAAIQTVTAKEGLNFKENVIVTDNGINKNYNYFWSGNAWVGVAGNPEVNADNTAFGAYAGTIQFPDETNTVAARADGTDFNARKTVPQYVDESYSDWDE